jgi:hypothetical protein
MRLKNADWLLAGLLAALAACTSGNESGSLATQGPPMPPMEEIERVDPIAPNPQQIANNTFSAPDLAQPLQYRWIVFTNLHVSDTSSDPNGATDFGYYNGREIKAGLLIDAKRKQLDQRMGQTEFECDTKEQVTVYTRMIFYLGGSMSDRFTCSHYDLFDPDTAPVILKRFEYKSRVDMLNGTVTLKGYWKEDFRRPAWEGHLGRWGEDVSRQSNTTISFRLSGSQCELLEYHYEEVRFEGTPGSGKPRFYERINFDKTPKSRCAFSNLGGIDLQPPDL